ncbi:MAG: sensor histidine kinase [candidate division Zixibacteria bacterium]|nr:sensor histidine kinase [candidate division Zixibacteria bacterium]
MMFITGLFINRSELTARGNRITSIRFRSYLGLICLLLLVSNASLFAQTDSQTEIDSLKALLSHKTGEDKVQVFNALSKAHWSQSSEQTIEYADRALVLSLKIKFKEGEATALKNKGVAYSNQGNNSKALEYYKKSLKIYQEIDNKTGIANSLNNIGVIHVEMDDYDKALEYYLKSMKIYEEIGDTGGVAASLVNTGTIYDILKNDDKAMSNYQESMKIFERIGDKSGVAMCLNNIGNIQSDLGNKDEALEFYQKSLKINKEIGDTYGIASAYLNIGYAFDDLEDYDKSLEYSQKALKIEAELGDLYGLAITYNNIGDLYRKLKKYSESYSHLRRSMELSEEIESKDMLKENYDCLSKLYYDQDNFKDAFDYYKKYSEIKDSIFTEESTNQVAEMQTKYDTEKKEKENELLRKETEIHQATIKRQYIITVSIGVGFILVIFLVLVMIRANNNKKKANRMLLEQKRQIEEQAGELQKVNDKLVELDHFKEGMTGMIVHDLKNPLSAVINYSDGKEDHSNVVIHQAGKQMLNMVMNILDVQKFEDAQMKLDTDDYNLFQIANDAINQVSFLSNEKSIDLVNNIPRDLSVIAESSIIERVFINVLTNALKYTPINGKTILEAELESDETIKISVTDNGEGIPKDRLDSVFDKFQQVQPKKSSSVRSTGLGLTFCKLAVESHGGNIGVTSKVGQGTIFWFTLSRSDKTTVAEELTSTAYTDELILSLSDRQELIPHIKQFGKHEVYEISDLKKLLKQIQTDSSPGISHWREEMQRAVYSCNDEKYQQLINI